MQHSEYWDNFKFDRWSSEINIFNFISNNFVIYDDDFSKICYDVHKKYIDLSNKINELLDRKQIDIKSINDDLLNDFSIILGFPFEKFISDKYFSRINANDFLNLLNEKEISCDQQTINLLKQELRSYSQNMRNFITPNMQKANEIKLFDIDHNSYLHEKIIADCRRVPLYGIDLLIKQKQTQLDLLDGKMMSKKITLRYEILLQIKSLLILKNMALEYGFDISRPAKSAREAMQWFFLSYLAIIRQNPSFFPSLGNNTSFFDIFIQKDINKGILNDKQAFELICNFVLKIKLLYFLYLKNTKINISKIRFIETIGGKTKKTTLITKTAFWFIDAVSKLGFFYLPRITILWSKKLPINFKKHCLDFSLKTNYLNYVNDDIYNKKDYAFTSFDSPLIIGKELALFTSSFNIAKCLQLAINSGRDEIKKNIKFDLNLKEIDVGSDIIYSYIWNRFRLFLDFTIRLYVNYSNIANYCFKNFNYNSIQFALYDADIKYYFSIILCGLDDVIRSFLTIKNTKVTPIFIDKIASDFTIEGEYIITKQNIKQIIKIKNKILNQFIKTLKECNVFYNAKPHVYLKSQHCVDKLEYNIGKLPCINTRKNMQFCFDTNNIYLKDKSTIRSIFNVNRKKYVQNSYNVLNILRSSFTNDKADNIDFFNQIISTIFKNNCQQIFFNIINDRENNKEKVENFILYNGKYRNFLDFSHDLQQEIISEAILIKK